MPVLNVLKGDRFVFVGELPGSSFKLFQIAFASSDGSLFVTFPYLKGCGVRMGEVTLPAGLREIKHFNVGESFATSSQLVKYAHHPSGQAHFSLDGRVRTTGIRQSVPLSAVSGHLFTVRFQGLRAFTKVEANEKSTIKRQLVPFLGSEEGEIKIVCQLFSESELKRQLHTNASNDSFWIPVELPDGKRVPGVPLATPFIAGGERRHLFVYADTRPAKWLAGAQEAISFLGGFDSCEHVDDYTKPTSCLMLFAHRMPEVEQLRREGKTVDL